MKVTIEQLIHYFSISLLLLRILVGIEFLSSGWADLTKLEERSKSLELSKPFTFLLGLGELVCGICIVLGIYVQIFSIPLIIIMLGAISFKIFKWKTGYFGQNSAGWHYDALLLSANLIFLFSGGGRFVLLY